MKTIYIIVLTSCAFIHIYAQEFTEEVPDKAVPSNSVNMQSFSYPVFLDGEIHSNFKVSYSLSKNLVVRLQGFYDSNREDNRFSLPISTKYFFSDKFYVFSGMEYEFQLNKYGKDLVGQPRSTDSFKFKPRFDYSGGVGYEVDRSFMIEAKTNYQLNDSKLKSVGQPANGKNFFSLRSKYKF